MKKIYGYYQSISLANQSEEFSCANYWKHSWSENGWEPVMLNRSHAQGSPLYLKLQAKLVNQALGISMDLRNQVDWITARFVRWCALHAAGGGWMSDYDVANLGFTPEKAEEYEKGATLQINASSPAYIFYASQDHCANAIKKFISEELINENNVLLESNILNVNSGFDSILPLVNHAKSSNDENRSEIMNGMIKQTDDKP